LEAKAELSGWRAHAQAPTGGASGVIRLAERYRFHKYCGAKSTPDMGVAWAYSKDFQIDEGARGG
jgi:hypothetical protein